MHATLCRAGIFLAFLSLPGAVTRASAQGRVYLQASVFADVRQFGSTSADSGLATEPFSPDATGIGGSVRIGTWLHPKWTLEAGFDAGSRTTVDLDDALNLPIFPSRLLPFELKSSSRFTTATTMIGFHQQMTPRLALGYRAGFSFVRATYRTDFPDIVLPPPVFSGDLPFAIIDFPLQFGRRTLTSSENSGALALGFEAAIGVNERIAIVPELRAMAFSSPGPGVFLIRPGAGVRWSF